MDGPITWFDLDRVEYADGLELQRQFIDARKAGTVGDALLLLEHPPVLTLGRGAKTNNILAPADRLEALGVATFETDRGGDVTYHGPGQLVGYPLFHLPPGRQDVRRYVRDIEEVIIRTLADFGLTATRMPKWPGVWMERSRHGGPRKICALGVHLSRWYTRHGFALNVTTNLSHFELIVPCGISEAGVTSMQVELGEAPPMAEVKTSLVRHVGEVFGAPLREGPAPMPTVSVAVVAREGPRVLLLERHEHKGGFWQIVTGRVEPGETPEAAAARELNEETGLAAPVRPLDLVHAFALGTGSPPRLGRETAFAAVVERPFDARLDEREHRAWQWVTPPEALERLPWEGLKEAVRRALR